MLRPLRNQTGNLTPKLYITRFTEIEIYSFYCYKAQQRPKEICVVKQQPQEQPQKSHERDIQQKHLKIDPSIFFASYGTHVMNYFASLGIFVHQRRRTQRYQNHWQPVVCLAGKQLGKRAQSFFVIYVLLFKWLRARFRRFCFLSRLTNCQLCRLLWRFRFVLRLNGSDYVSVTVNSSH